MNEVHVNTFRWTKLIGRVALLLAAFGIDLSTAYPTAAGWCPGGIPAVGGAHLDPTKVIVTGSLASANYSIDIDRKITLTPSSDVDNPSIVLETGVDYLLRIVAQLKRYKGFLIRLQAPSKVDTSTALIPSSLAQIAEVCSDPVVGVCHFNSDLKNFAGGTLRIDEPSYVFLDVTVVRENTDAVSSYFYSRYTLKFEKSGVVDQCNASEAVAEKCLLTDLEEADSTECSDCITTAFADTGKFKNCDDLQIFTCDVLNNCKTCGSCIDELESLFQCEFARDLNCTLDCGFTSAPTASTEPPVAPSTMPVAPPVATSAPSQSSCSDTKSLYEACADENFTGKQKDQCEACVTSLFPPTGSDCETYRTDVCEALVTCDCACSIPYGDYLECLLNTEPGLEDCSLDCGALEPPTPGPSTVSTPVPSLTPEVPTPLPSQTPTALPTSVAPTSEAPTSAAPSTPLPQSDFPSQTPTGLPTSVAPTSEAPTTVAPSTPLPQSDFPSQTPTSLPTSVAPTSEAPTTVAPSTPLPQSDFPSQTPTTLPTSVAPTSEAPTSVAPTSAAPTTSTPSDFPSQVPSPLPTTLAPTAAAPHSGSGPPTATTAAPSVTTPSAPVTSVPTVSPGADRCNATVASAQSCLETSLTDEEKVACGQCVLSAFDVPATGTTCDDLQALTCATLSNCTTCSACLNELEASLDCTFVLQYGCSIDCSPEPLNCTGKLQALSDCLPSGEESTSCLSCLTIALGDLPDNDCEKINEIGCQSVSGCPCTACETEVQDWVGCALEELKGCKVDCLTNQTSSG